MNWMQRENSLFISLGLNLFTSNRMEVLVDALAATLREPPASPFTREVIVVQSKGMQRWLSMQLASRFGVWANGHYPFPNAVVQELFELFFVPHPDSSMFAPEVMTWKIMRLLPELIETPPFGTLQHYLADDHDGLKRFQLSEQIADTFDQYTLYRSEMLQRWKSAIPDAAEEIWQATLWRKLTLGHNGRDRGQLKESFCQKLNPSVQGVEDFPKRIALFGISYLPKFHLDILSAVSKLTEVNLFLLSPTREYWGDIISKKTIARLSAPERALRTEGHPLLASLGTIGRDFSEMVLDLSEETFIEEENYVDPGESTLLHALQSDILNLVESGEGCAMRNLDTGDHSLWIHSCHTPLREIEVLHDNILFMLEHISDLTPRDIVVMTPDIETYSPYISSVFGSGEGSSALHFSIADRRMMNEGEIAAAVLKLLALYGSRFRASEIIDLLVSPPVKRRFVLNDEELEIIRVWIETTGIRWGMDEGDRSSRGLPSYRANSWMAGLDRLLLGYAMQDENILFNGILPYDDLAASASDTLGKFAEFVHRVDTLVKNLDRPRSLGEWRLQFQALLDDFILPDADSEREFTAIALLSEQIAESAASADFTGDVSPAVVLSWFRSRLEQQEQGIGFMTGGITFCAMLPMRSIPFRVVALIGMNDSSFPRQSRAPGFDLIALNPCRGDRSLRNEDRYLFLESILSARDLLYISYVGQSIRDNTESSPSVLVSELLDTVKRGFSLQDGRSTDEHLVVRHRMQAFHPEYFTADSQLFSYSAENYRALVEKEGAAKALRPFMTTPLQEPPEELKTIPLDRLLRFYDNPAAFFLQHRLGIQLESIAAPLEDREPFEVEGVDRYILKKELLKVELDGGDPLELLPLFRSRGLLPPARHGEELFKKILDEVHTFAEAVEEITGSTQPLAPLEIDLQLGDFRLTGMLDRVWPGSQLHYRCAKLKVKDQMRSWIEHLVLNTMKEPGYPLETTLVMSNNVKHFTAEPSAASHLESLLQHYWQGQSMPLRFFPRSSFAYAAKNSLDAARKEWRDDTFNNHPGESSDPAIHRCFASQEPFNEEFCSLAISIAGPCHGPTTKSIQQTNCRFNFNYYKSI